MARAPLRIRRRSHPSGSRAFAPSSPGATTSSTSRRGPDQFPKPMASRRGSGSGALGGSTCSGWCRSGSRSCSCAVATAKGLRNLPAVERFIARNPGTLETAGARTNPGIPAWVGGQHFLNLLLLLFIMRSGLQILSDHPRLYWTRHSTPGREWFRIQKPVPDEPAVDRQAGLHQPAGTDRPPGHPPLHRPRPLVASRDRRPSGCSTASCSTSCCSRPGSGVASCPRPGRCSRTRCRC